MKKYFSTYTKLMLAFLFISQTGCGIHLFGSPLNSEDSASNGVKRKSDINNQSSQKHKKLIQEAKVLFCGKENQKEICSKIDRFESGELIRYNGFFRSVGKSYKKYTLGRFSPHSEYIVFYWQQDNNSVSASISHPIPQNKQEMAEIEEYIEKMNHKEKTPDNAFSRYLASKDGKINYRTLQDESGTYILSVELRHSSKNLTRNTTYMIRKNQDKLYVLYKTETQNEETYWGISELALP